MLRDQPLLVIKDDLDNAKKKLFKKLDEISFHQKKGIIYLTIKIENSPYSAQLSLTVPPGTHQKNFWVFFEYSPNFICFDKVVF